MGNFAFLRVKPFGKAFFDHWLGFKQFYFVFLHFLLSTLEPSAFAYKP